MPLFRQINETFIPMFTNCSKTNLAEIPYRELKFYSPNLRERFRYSIDRLGK
jgi:hypothetical protein